MKERFLDFFRIKFIPGFYCIFSKKIKLTILEIFASEELVELWIVDDREESFIMANEDRS